MLSDSQLREYAENGFLALGRVMSDDQLHALQARVDDLTGGPTPNERIGYQTKRRFGSARAPMRNTPGKVRPTTTAS